MEGTRLDLCSSFGFIIDLYSSQGREGLGRGVGGGTWVQSKETYVRSAITYLKLS